jgi:two-component system, OmpR family, response regulator
MRKLRVLVVDDDVQHLELVRRSLRAFGIDVETSDSSLGVSAIIRRTEPDLVLLDVNIPALPGDALLGLARRHAPPKTKFILFSSDDEASLRKTAATCGADGYITKSADAAVLATYLQKVFTE